jgi:spermidine/putrescine transport system substrate-binding protein
LFASAAILAAGAAQAEGELNIYNWGNYTSPELIEKFEAAYDVKVTITDYDSSDTALAKVEAGGHGFDVLVIGNGYLPIFAEKGLLMESRPDEMENFKNVAPEWVDVDWDPGRHYSVPFQWGSVGVSVNTSVYSGDPNTSTIFMDPPPELVGKVNVVPEMRDVLNLAIMYVGGEACTTDKEVLKKARDAIVAAKESWMSMDYGMTEKMSNNDVAASVNWNGSSYRIRQNNPDVVYGFPAEGYPLWMDSAAMLADAKNVDNAKLFLDFIMDPENAAMLSAFAGYANGITGSDAFMPEEMKSAPEIVVPEELAAAGKFSPTCSAEAQQFYTAIWTELQK